MKLLRSFNFILNNNGLQWNVGFAGASPNRFLIGYYQKNPNREVFKGKNNRDE